MIYTQNFPAYLISSLDKLHKSLKRSEFLLRPNVVHRRSSCPKPTASREPDRGEPRRARPRVASRAGEILADPFDEGREFKTFPRETPRSTPKLGSWYPRDTLPSIRNFVQRLDKGFQLRLLRGRLAPGRSYGGSPRIAPASGIGNVPCLWYDMRSPP